MFVPLRRVLAAAAAGVSLLVPGLMSGVQSAPSAQTSRQYQMAAEEAVQNPFRVDVQPVQQGVKQGSPAVLKIQLHNANNVLANANEKMSFVVKALSPAGKEQTHNVEIPSGNNTAQVTLAADEAGLWRVEVRESNDHLAGGSSYLLVSPAQPVNKAVPHRPPRGRPVSPKPPGSAALFVPRLLLASYTPPTPVPSQASEAIEPGPVSKPEVRLTVSGAADNTVLADGIAVANVGLFLSPPQSTDVQVWLKVSDGQVSPQMVTIKAGDSVGTAQWASKTIAEHATISIKDVIPKIETEVVSQIISFTDPIVAIAFFNPPDGLNIVERGTVAVQFLDRNGVPVPAHAPISFSFSANSPRLRLIPISSRTQPDSLNFHAAVIPSGLGSVTIEAAVPHLSPIKKSINITGLLLLILCVLGGAMGGVVNHLDRRQKGLAASLVTGMVVALPITWLYVWVGLPHVDASILHNQLSAVMVAIIAGVGGAGGLKLVAKQFKLNLFESAEKNAAGAPA